MLHGIDLSHDDGQSSPIIHDQFTTWVVYINVCIWVIVITVKFAMKGKLT